MFICNARKQNIPDLTDQHQSEAAFEGKGIFQNCEVHRQVFPFFPLPLPANPLRVVYLCLNSCFVHELRVTMLG